MKLSLFILLAFPALAYAQQDATSKEAFIELPIKFVDGYGPFETKSGFWVHTWDKPDPESAWSKTEVEVSGLPEHWSETMKQKLAFDSNQLAYQDYKAGKITEEHFNTLIEQWDIDLSVREYSDQPIQCFAYLIMGKNKDGEVRYMIDTDNDLDFSDEEEKIPVLFDSSKRHHIPVLAAEAETVAYERVMSGQVEKVEAPVFVMMLRKDWLMHNIPQHAKTWFNNKEIRICSDGFTNTAYDNSAIAIMTSDTPVVVNQGEVFTLDGQQYKNVGVRISSKVLTLQRVQKDIDLHLPQIGYRAPLFSGKEFTSGSPITLKSFSGKFLYVEFWGSWCAPCIKELPYLKQAYSQLDSSKISFLGIAYDDNPQRLRKLLEKEEIKWPQILTQKADSIVDTYHITGYPTSFLIDPAGNIIAKNLRGENLITDILKYMKD